jgi:S1-C subfamily serine protease/thiol-disulfide isomerase/thioredoxin
MPISVACGKCQTVLAAPDAKAGQRAKCPKCGAVLSIPAVGAVAPDGQKAATAPAKPRANPATAPLAPGPRAPVAGLAPVTDPALGDIDLSLPLQPAALSAPAASLSKSKSDWSGKSSRWKDVPTWVWFVRGAAVVVALLVLAQGVLFLTKLVSGGDADPPVATQGPDQAAPSTTVSGGSAVSPAEEKKPTVPLASGISTRPLVGSQPVPPPAPSPSAVSSTPLPSPIGTEKTPVQIIDDVSGGIVQITVVDSIGRETVSGTGFVIDHSGLVATNFHVLAKAHLAQAKFRNGMSYNIAGYRAFDEARDLAIVQLSGAPPVLTTLKLHSTGVPKSGSEVIAMGSPSGFRNTFVTGVIDRVQPTVLLPPAARQVLHSPDDNTWIQTTALIARDKTGGPLLNKQGEVIGVHTWTAESLKLGFATHAKHLATLIGQLKPDVMDFDKVTATAIQKDKFSRRTPPVAALLEEFRTAYDAFNRELKEQTEEGRSQQQIAHFVATSNPVPIFTEKFFALAEQNRQQLVALESLASVCELLHLPGAYSSPAFLRATSRMLQDHLNDPALGDVLVEISHSANDESLSWLRQICQKAKEPLVAGPACYALARALQESQSSALSEAEIVALLERVARDFADLPHGEITLGMAASALQFEVQHLSVGKQAPEIVGLNLAGQEFKLSDFRGKVLVIDFFADWCPNCSSMYLQERALVEQLKDKPFALVGVNLDRKERFQYVVDSKLVTWRCWWDGPEGPIATRWNVRSLPTIFVLDRQGIVRYKFSGALGTSFAEAIQQLLNEKSGTLPINLQFTADGDLQENLDKLAAVVGTQPYPLVVDAAVLLIQAHHSKATKPHLDLIEGWIQKGLEAEPDSFSLLLARNRLQQFQGNVPEAVRQLRELLKRKNLDKQQSIILKFELAQLLVMQSDRASKDAAEGLQLIDDVIFQADATMEMIDTRAMAYLASNMLPQARAEIAAVITNRPGPMAYFHLALIESASSNAPAAKDALQRATAAGLNTAPLTSFEQKQLQRLAKSLGVSLRK